MDKAAIMKNAWTVARQYIAAALRMAWQAVKPLAVIADELLSLWGVENANVWEKHGHRRIYIELTKFNGGKHWNGGVGWAGFYDANTKELVQKVGWAGAATRENHARTMERIRSILSL